jgi:HEAT repeat protein
MLFYSGLIIANLVRTINPIAIQKFINLSHLRLMELAQITENLQQADYQHRLTAVAALKAYPADVAIPLLKHTQHDAEFLVRSFVARELGYFITDESFAILLEIMRCDNTPNVRAEAANSLSLFGVVSAGHLVAMFVQDDHWLVRRSILAALCDLGCHGEVWEVAQEAIANLEDAPTREAAILALGTLAATAQARLAIAKLDELSGDPSWRVRQQVAYALKSFMAESNTPDLLTKLQQDEDHRVVAAALETLVP